MPELYTIGHSTHEVEEFLKMLFVNQITCLVDVRLIPKSRRVPWANKESLREALKKEKIEYVHLPELGGMRKPNKNSINIGWRNSSFRGYADYMQTPEFFNALKKLNDLIKNQKKVVMMCAEALPWRCHRSLIADAEIARGIKVMDIMSATSLQIHTLTPFAIINKKTKPIQVYYPKAEGTTKDMFE